MENKDFNIKVLGTISPYSKLEKNCPGFLVNYGDNKILLDCGNGISRLLNLPEDLKNLSIFISHFHKDHYSDLFSLAYASFVYNNLGILKDKIKIYMPKIYEPRDWERSYNEGYYDYMLIKHMKEKYFEINTYDEFKCIELNDLKISFMENKHDYTCYSTKLEDTEAKVIYTSDTGYESAKKLINFASDADLLIAESTFVRSDNQFSENHLHAYQSAEIAKYAKVKKLLLTHFWTERDPLDYLNEAKPIFENTEAAEEGNILTLSRCHNG